MYNNLISEDYLIHYGVKGMKWGVRHDKPSLGKRYSDWGRNSANKRYDKKSAQIEKRRQKRSEENFLKDTKYGKTVDKISNNKFDKAQNKIEARRIQKNKEFDSFDNRDIKDLAKKGAIAAGVIAGGATALYMIKSGNVKQLANFGKKFFGSKPSKTFTQVMSPNKTYPTAFPKSSNPIPKKISSSSVETGKATTTKILKNNSSTNNIMSWEELAKRNKELLNKSFNWSDYSLEDLRKMDLY